MNADEPPASSTRWIRSITGRLNPQRHLNRIESLGNRLPEPMTIFLVLIAVTIGLSAVLSAANVTVAHPESGETVPINSLISGEGLRYILTSLVDNFVGFAPVGLVLTIMIGIGLADRVGLLETLIKRVMLSMPSWILPYAVFFVANTAVIAADAAFLIVPPLAAIVYRTVGRHPLAGIITAFAGSSSGYGSGVVITSQEPLLAGISTDAAAILGSDIVVTAVDNYFFAVVAVIVCTLVGGAVTRWVTETRLGLYEGERAAPAPTVTAQERRALIASGLVALAYVVIVATVALIPTSPLRNDDGGLAPSPFLDGIVPILLLFFVAIGLTYGRMTGKISNGRDVSNYFAEAIGGMRYFIVIIFFIAQFSAFFNWTNIGLWVAVNGAEFLIGIEVTGIVTLVGVITLSALITLLITSGSGLWAILAPIFVPMFMQLGYHPAAIQMAYRIGDSATSMVTPLMPYMIVILGFMREWDKDRGLGSIISYTIPYAVALFVVQSALFLLFYWLGLPLGPGVGFRLED